MSEEKKKWETKPGTGSAFVNRRKQKDTHPDYTGEMNIDGKLHWVSIWVKTTQSGDNWMSISFNPKEPRTGDIAPASLAVPIASATKAEEPIDDSVPF